MKTIALSGKGGTGKTTLAALIIRWLSRNVTKSILAVDADSNVNLNEVLGVELKATVGAIREEMRAKAAGLAGGMTKQQFLEYKIQTGLTESADFDLLAMGRPEGPGCYCYANNLLRDILATLSRNYEFVVIDNEAGMEHLSRRTTQTIDYLLIISDPSVRGIRAAGKISRLVQELETRVQAKHLLLNRSSGLLPPEITEAIGREGLNMFWSIPEDAGLLNLDQSGRPIWHLEDKTPAGLAVDDMLRTLLNFKRDKEATNGL
jgi:CO dehydrogenase maturation factor